MKIKKKSNLHLTLRKINKACFGTTGGKLLRLWVAAVVLSLLLPVVPVINTSAASLDANIDMSDTSPPAAGTGWTYSGGANGVYTILAGADVTIVGDNQLDLSSSPSPSQRRIVVSGNATITLEDVSITELAQGQSPISLSSGVVLDLKFTGSSTLTGGATAAGIQVPVGTTLNINGTDSLTAQGGGGVSGGPGGGAGIGGSGTTSSLSGTAGTISIDSGAITATGGDNGAGIGGGADGSGGTITISGGTINATGGSWGGAGIGGGSAFDAAHGGVNGSGGIIEISGGAVTAVGGDATNNTGVGGGAGIGGAGANNNAYGATSTSGASGRITISDSAEVTATGGNGGANGGGAGIGSGGQGGNGAVGEAGFSSASTIDINPTTPISARGGTSTSVPPISWNGASVGYGGGSNPSTYAGQQMLPAAPTNLQAAIQTDGSVLLTWNPPPNLAMSTFTTFTYEIIVDDSVIATGQSSPYSVPSAQLQPNKPHTFVVRAATQFSAIGPQVEADIATIEITSANNTSVVAGSTGNTFQVTVSGSLPTKYELLDTVPTGVTINETSGLMTIDATDLTAGSYPFTVWAGNDLENDTQTFTINVTALAVAPSITSDDYTSVVTGTGGTFQVTTTGTLPITLSLDGTQPSGVSINSSTGLMTIAAGVVPANVYTFTITASGISDVTQDFTLTVTEAPTIITPDNTSVVAGSTGNTFQVTATGTPATMTYSLDGSEPDGIIIDPSTGLMTIDGTLLSMGSYNFKITATNGSNPAATQNFTLTVTAPPTITSANNTTIVGSAGGTFQVLVDGSTPITYSLTGAPAGTTINTVGLITFPANTDPLYFGTYSFTITATNEPEPGIPQSATQSFTLTVNQAPTITSANNASVAAGTGGTFQVTATGYPATMTYSLSAITPAATGIGINSTTGLITVAPTVDPGAYTFIITAANTISPDATQSFTLTVNQAPTISSVNNTTAVTGMASTFTVTATGFPTPTLSLTGAPAGVVINSSTGVITIPATLATGPYSFNITASNGISPNATQSFTLTVNQPPVITSSNYKSVVSGVGGTFQVTATGTVSITYTLSGTIPAGVTISSDGLITSPPGVPLGTHTFTVVASNITLQDATQSFTLDVTAAPVPPTITSADNTSISFNSGGTFQVTATGTTSLGTPMSFSLTGAPTGVSIDDPITGLMTFSTSIPAGTYVFNINASNGISPDASEPFTLTVTQPPAPPPTPTPTPSPTPPPTPTPTPTPTPVTPAPTPTPTPRPTPRPTAAPQASPTPQPTPTPSPQPTPTPTPTPPPPSPTPEPTPTPPPPASGHTHTPGGTNQGSPPLPTVHGRQLAADGNNWIEYDENGEPFGIWTWDEEAGMWIFEKLPPLASWNIADTLEDSMGIIAVIMLAVIGGGALIWWCIAYKRKHKK